MIINLTESELHNLIEDQTQKERDRARLVATVTELSIENRKLNSQNSEYIRQLGDRDAQFDRLSIAHEQLKNKCTNGSRSDIDSHMIGELIAAMPNKIAMIKVVRDITKKSLAEAKKIVESNYPDPEWGSLLRTPLSTR
jgi:ribosomal protein L7/L12